MTRVFFDIDTQLDFVCPGGALYAPGAEGITANLSLLTKYAAAQKVKLLSTTDAHLENDPEFAAWKPHCVTGTAGQQKLSATLLDRRYVLSSGLGALDLDAALAAPQIIIEKQSVDAFTNPNLTALLDALKPAEFIVYGVVTEVCVWHAAHGVLRRGESVEIVSDAIQALSGEHGEAALRELAAGGARITTTSRVIG